ncbi:glutathione hydrolase 1 proenzyme-like [Gigantopelta aegis]|uniref:glutathione hydrolase 1 proenzyme-like n=1 Tax=Gigantopelta aegis TaxID=1735272 RepID=UPI001B88CFBD|nr:glutathione hydrolase 1 proenzyme-like [Gigantopelta aegis]
MFLDASTELPGCCFFPPVIAEAGGLASGIPGEIMGYWEAYKIGGKLPWSELFQPAIKICEDGFPFPPPTEDALIKIRDEGYLGRNPNLRNLLTNPETKKYYKRGEKIRRPEYARTLRIIASEGYQAFYNGSLTATIVKELTDAGGIMTEADLRSYYAIVKKPVISNLNNNMRIISPPPPSGGLVLQFILNILSGYNFTPYDLLTTEKTVLTYHRIVEAFKFAFAKRSSMGDADVEDQDFKNRINDLIKNLTSKEYGNYVRSQINDDKTQKTMDYGPAFSIVEDAGTGHISLLAPNGDAVATTTTVNLHFGSKIVGAQTGIVYNNQMDDFSTPNTTNYWGVPASASNFIKPGKRPLSSMSPSIIVEDDGDVALIVGASGGTRIITGSSLTAINALWFNKGIKAAVDYPRIHHQLLPKALRVEEGFPPNIIAGLKAKGHDIEMYPTAGSYVQAVLQKAINMVTVNCDYRKYGIPDGY